METAADRASQWDVDSFPSHRSSFDIKGDNTSTLTSNGPNTSSGTNADQSAGKWVSARRQAAVGTGYQGERGGPPGGSGSTRAGNYPGSRGNDMRKQGLSVCPHRWSSVSSSLFLFGTDEATVRVTNLPEETQEQDLRDLFIPFGPVSRVFLAKDKTSNTSKGFAFITFNEKKDAQKAIECVSGFGYDHLILKVEWAKWDNERKLTT